MEKDILLSRTEAFIARLHLLKQADIGPLREVIREHNTRYYRDESPIISDYEYDQLFHALARLEEAYHDLDPESPTSRLSVLLSSQFQKVRHQYPMISLDNTYSLDEIREFEVRVRNRLRSVGYGEKTEVPLQYFLQPKFDGLGLALIYTYGRLTQVVTRGNGVEGEDVTANALEVSNIPHEIASIQTIPRFEVRGEIVMPHASFHMMNEQQREKGEKIFANPRNAASGSLRQLDPLITRGRGLRFYAYSIPQFESDISGIMSEATPHTYSEIMTLLAGYGFETGALHQAIFHSLDTLIMMIERENNIQTRTKFAFDTDGLVIKIDDLTLWGMLGTTEHHPRYAVAYKFPPTLVRTRVLSIEHSVGRTGVVTPVANLAPVTVSGVTVRRATLHNYDELGKKDIREGDSVYIVRAGEVIPEVVMSIPEARTGTERYIFPPTLCPICLTPLRKETDKVALLCPNRHCPAQIQGRFETFVGKQGLNIDGLGEKQIELFLEQGWLTDFASVFGLLDHLSQIRALEGYKEKSIENLRLALERARHTTLERLVTALGIPNVGRKTAKILSRALLDGLTSGKMQEVGPGKSDTLSTAVRLVHILFSYTPEMLETLHDIGPETARSIVLYLDDNHDALERLFHTIEITDPLEKENHERNTLASKSFCVTGTFKTISRDALHAMIETHGGEVRTSVTSKLDYLIVGGDAGSKLAKATSLGVTILSLEEFENML